jgi:hypothetical protein
LKVLLIIVGILLLAPGICSLGFMVMLLPDMTQDALGIWVLWIPGLAASAFGIWLIRYAMKK